MPAKKSKSGIVAKLGSAGQAAWNKHKEDEVRYAGGEELPAGIEGGVAQLVECKFDVYKKGPNAGEYFFHARGVILEPKEFGGQKLEGRHTSITKPLCETEFSSLEENIDKVMNELRKLGVDTTEVSFEDIEEVAASLKEEQPYFRFRTWKGEKTKEFPNPRLNEDWRGRCEYEASEETEDVVDETDGEVEEEEAGEQDLESLAVEADGGSQEAQNVLTEAAEAAGVDPEEYDTWSLVVEAIQSASSPKSKKSAKPAKAKAAPVEEEEEEEAEEEDENEVDTSDISLQDLGDLADEGDEESMEKLTERAAEAELDPDEYASWKELAEALVELRSSGGDEEEEEEEEEEATPEKGEIYFYKPPKAKKAIECEVILVMAKAKTVSLKSLDDNKVFKGVAWSELKQS